MDGRQDYVLVLGIGLVEMLSASQCLQLGACATPSGVEWSGILGGGGYSERWLARLAMWKFQVLWEILTSVSKSSLQGLVACTYNNLSLQEAETERLTQFRLNLVYVVRPSQNPQPASLGGAHL